MTAVLDASPEDSSRVEQPSTMPDGVSALGSLDMRRMTDELRDWTFRLADMPEPSPVPTFENGSTS
jgi:hypothetical protein